MPIDIHTYIHISVCWRLPNLYIQTFSLDLPRVQWHPHCCFCLSNTTSNSSASPSKTNQDSGHFSPSLPGPSHHCLLPGLLIQPPCWSFFFCSCQSPPHQHNERHHVTMWDRFCHPFALPFSQFKSQTPPWCAFATFLPTLAVTRQQPHWLSCCPSNTPSRYLPQGLCTCHFLYWKTLPPDT